MHEWDCDTTPSIEDPQPRRFNQSEAMWMQMARPFPSSATADRFADEQKRDEGETQQVPPAELAVT